MTQYIVSTEFHYQLHFHRTEISESKFDHYTCYCGQESLRRNGAALTVNKGVQNAVPGCSLKNDSMNDLCSFPR